MTSHQPNMSRKLIFGILCVFDVSLALITADICTSNVCEYVFDVRHARSMTIRQSGTTFNVHLNGSQLVPDSPNRFGKSISGDVGPNDVITLDGVQRNVITVNKTIPGPTIEVMEGAQIVVHVRNFLLTKAVAIHWHGLHQKNTAWMDGVPYLTQCPIIPRQSFTYRFKAYPPGTHWYHAHLVNQRNDGLYGMLIIHRQMPVMPEFSLMVSDWHHHEADMAEILSLFGSQKGPGDLISTGAEVAYGPDGVETSSVKYESSLINGRGRYDDNKAPLTIYSVMSGGQYRYRSVNVAGERTYEVSIDDHALTIVALDGGEIEHITADSIIINPGERVDFIIQANEPISSYWIRSRTMRIGKGKFPTYDGVMHGTNAVLKYDGSPNDEPTTSPKMCTSQNKCKVFNCQFGGYATRLNKECIQLDTARSVRPPNELAEEFGLSKAADITLFLNIAFVWGSSINARKFHFPSMPWSEPKYKEGLVSCNTEECSNPDTGCVCSNIQNLPYNKTIDLVMLSYEPASDYVAHHSMHLHGHNFAVLKVGFPPYNSSTGFYSGQNNDIMCANNLCKTARWNGQSPKDFNLVNPPIKDTVLAPARGYVVIRFRSTNPGSWLLHCHSDSHLSEGMTMVFDEAINLLPPTQKDFPRCHSFDWSEADFENLLDKKQNRNTGNMEDTYSNMDNYSPEVESQENQSQETEESERIHNTQQETQRSNNYFIKEGQVVLRTADLIGLIIGSIAFGAAIVILMSCLHHLCRRKKQQNTKM